MPNRTEQLLEEILNDLQELIVLQEAAKKKLNSSRSKKSDETTGSNTGGNNVTVNVNGDAADTVALLSGLGVLGDKDAGKNIINILSSLNKLKIDEKKIEAAKNAILSLADGLSKLKISKNNVKGLEALQSLLVTIGGLGISGMMTLWMAGKVLNEKGGKSIAAFVKAIVDPINEYKKETIEHAAEILKAVGTMMLYISGAIAILVILAMVDLQKTIIASALVVGIIVTLLGLALLISIIPGKMLAKGIEGLESIAKTAMWASISIGILTLLMTLFDVEEVLISTAIVVGIIVTLLVLTLKLASTEKKQLVEAEHVLDAIKWMMFSIVAAIGIMALLITIFDLKTILIGAGIVIGIILLIVGVMAMVSKITDPKSLHEVRQMLLMITASLLIISLLALFVFAPIYENASEILLGAGVVLLIVTALGLIALGLYWAIQKIGGDKGVKDISILLAVLTGVLTVISILAIYAFAKIALFWDDILIGAGIVLLIVAVLGALTVGLYWSIQKIGGDKGVKDISILLGVMTAVVLAISLIALLILVPLGAVWGEAVAGSIVVLGIVGVLELLALGLIKLTKHIKDDDHMKQLLYVLLGMLGALLVVSLITYFLLIPIGKEGKDALIGGGIVLGIIALLELMAVALVKFLESYTRDQIFNAGILLGELLVALLAVSLITNEILIPIGQDAENALKGAGVVLGILVIISTIAVLLVLLTKETSLKDIASAALILGAVTVSFYLISEIVLNSIVPILQTGVDLTDVAIAAAIMIGITASLMALTLILAFASIALEEVGGIAVLLAAAAILVILAVVVDLLAIALDIFIKTCVYAGDNSESLDTGIDAITSTLWSFTWFIIPWGMLMTVTGSVAMPGAIMGFMLLGLTTAALLAVLPTLVSLTKLAATNEETIKKGMPVITGLITDLTLFVTVLGLFTIIPLILVILAAGAAAILALAGVVDALNAVMPPFIKLAIQAGQNDKAVKNGAKTIIDVIGNFKDLAVELGKMVGVPFFGGGELKKGIVVLRELAEVLRATSVAMQEYFKMLKEADGVDLTKPVDIPNIVRNWMNMAIAIGKFVKDPWAAVAMLLGSTLMKKLAPFMLNISKVMINYIELLDQFGEVDTSNATALTNWIGGPGGFCEAIIKISDALEKVSGVGPKKIKKATEAIMPIFTSLKNFMEVIQMYADMKYPTKWNDEGQAIEYKKFTSTEFSTAANAISESFKTFIIKLSEAFKDFPKSATKAMKRMKDSIIPITESVKNFVDAIVTMASGQIPVEWNENGQAIKYELLDLERMKTAATNISDAFGAFIDVLGPKFEAMGDKTAAVIAIMGEGIGGIMSGVKQYTDAILAFVAGTETEVMVDGRLLKVRTKIDPEEFKQAGATITEAFMGFIDALLPLIDEDKYSDKVKVTMKSYGVTQEHTFGKDDMGVIENDEWVVQAGAKIGHLMESLSGIGSLISQIEPLSKAVVNVLNLVKKTGMTWDDLTIGASKVATSIVNLVGALAINDGVRDKAKELQKPLKIINDNVMKILSDIVDKMVKIQKHSDAFTTSIDLIGLLGTDLANETNVNNYKKTKTTINDYILPSVKSFKNVMEVFAMSTTKNAANNGDKVVKMLNSFTDSIIKYMDIQNQEFNTKIISDLCNTLNDSYHLINKNYGDFINVYQQTSNGFNMFIQRTYIKPVNEAAKANHKLADTFRDLDKALLEKERKRSDAMNKFAEELKNIGEQLNYVSIQVHSLDGKDSLLDRIEDRIKVLKEQAQDLSNGVNSAAGNNGGLSADELRNVLNNVTLREQNNGYRVQAD